MPRSSLPSLLLLAASLGGCSDVPASPRGATQTIGLAAQSSGDGGVTAVISDADTSIAPALQIRSDGLGAYTNSRTLTSVIQSIGAWLLDSYTPRNSTRTVYLDFSQAIPGSGPNGGNPVPLPSGLYKVHMISKCNLYGNGMLTLAPGATMSCPLHLGEIYSGGVKYALQMNPYLSSADTAYAETNYANIMCVVPSSGAGPCTQWRITPSGTAPIGAGNVAALLRFTTSKGQTTTVKQGDFYFSFSISVTNP